MFSKERWGMHHLARVRIGMTTTPREPENPQGTVIGPDRGTGSGMDS
jgi:hypothetical protein